MVRYKIWIILAIFYINSLIFIIIGYMIVYEWVQLHNWEIKADVIYCINLVSDLSY